MSGEDKAFIPPKFDRAGFIKDEIRDAKSTFISVMFGLLMGFVSYIIHIHMGSLEGAAVIGLISVVVLKILFASAGVDISGFKLKNWLGNALWYVLTWVAIWIIMVNPPITDIVPPDVRFATGEDVEAAPGDDTGNITIDVKVWDNSAISHVWLSFTKLPKAMTTHTSGKWYEMEHKGGDIYYFRPPNGTFAIGEYMYKIKAVDDNGRVTTTEDRKLDIHESEPPILTPTTPNGTSIQDGVLKIYVSDISGVERAEYRDSDKGGGAREAKVLVPKGEEREWQVIIDASTLPPGTYTYEITVYDRVGNSATIMHTFTVK